MDAMILTAAAVAAACSQAPNRQLDFWLGPWQVVENGEVMATSTIEPVSGGCAIREIYEQKDGYRGTSLSFHDPVINQWRQTWIDDSGSYLTFVGERRGDEVILAGEPRTRDGVVSQMRMVFTGITPSRFHWRWERTTDGGATWTPMMLIDYTR